MLAFIKVVVLTLAVIGGGEPRHIIQPDMDSCVAAQLKAAQEAQLSGIQNWQASCTLTIGDHQVEIERK